MVSSGCVKMGWGCAAGLGFLLIIITIKAAQNHLNTNCMLIITLSTSLSLFPHYITLPSSLRFLSPSLSTISYCLLGVTPPPFFLLFFPLLSKPGVTNSFETDLIGYRLMRRATSLMHTSEINNLFSLPLIMCYY